MKNLDSHYSNFKNVGSYSRLRSFYNGLNKIYSLNTIKNWLKQKDEYTLHKPIQKKFKRNKVYSYDIDYLWQADLVDVSKLSRYNNGFKYLLTCIDVLSKYGWIVALKDKTGLSITNAFKVIFKNRKPIKIHTDKGKEFLNKIFLDLLKSKNIQLYQTNSEMKACVVERFNRTIKEKMWRFFSKMKTIRYIDILDELCNSYNNTYHRSIKMALNQVNRLNVNQIFNNLYSEDSDVLVKFKYNIGDFVRIVKFKTLFDKGYTPNWTKEIFSINKKLIRNPPVYELKDLNNEIIEGVFYENELQNVYKFDDIFEIEKILKKRTKNGQTQYFVSWKGYPSKFNSWILEQDLLK